MGRLVLLLTLLSHFATQSSSSSPCKYISLYHSQLYTVYACISIYEQKRPLFIELNVAFPRVRSLFDKRVGFSICEIIGLLIF